jgi:hypothetical protein
VQSRGGVSVKRSRDPGHGGHRLDSNSEGLFVDYSVEAVVGVGGVVDGALGAIGVDERVASLDDVPTAHLVLALAVSSERIVDGVAEVVVGRGVRFGDVGAGHGSGVSDGGGDVRHGGRVPVGDASTDRGHQSYEDDELEDNKLLGRFSKFSLTYFECHVAVFGFLLIWRIFKRIRFYTCFLKVWSPPKF